MANLRLQRQFKMSLALHLGIRVDGPQGEPMLLVVVRRQVFPLDGHLTQYLVLLQVSVAIVNVNAEITEAPWHFELELLAKEGAVNFELYY